MRLVSYGGCRVKVSGYFFIIVTFIAALTACEEKNENSEAQESEGATQVVSSTQPTGKSTSGSSPAVSQINVTPTNSSSQSGETGNQNVPGKVSSDLDQPIQPPLPAESEEERMVRLRSEGLFTLTEPGQSLPPNQKVSFRSAAVNNSLPTRFSSETSSGFEPSTAPMGSGLQAAPVFVAAIGSCTITLMVDAIGLDSYEEGGGALFLIESAYDIGTTVPVQAGSSIYIGATIVLRPDFSDNSKCREVLEGKTTVLGKLDFSDTTVSTTESSSVLVKKVKNERVTTKSVSVDWRSPSNVFLIDDSEELLVIPTGIYEFSPQGKGTWYPKIRVVANPSI